ncbi:MAG: hypothetical protein ABIH41_04810 [Nanoarchaeota archaeon]
MGTQMEEHEIYRRYEEYNPDGDYAALIPTPRKAHEGTIEDLI